MLTDGRTTDGRTDDGRTTDAGVTGILIAHLGAFGSGELKNKPCTSLEPCFLIDQWLLDFLKLKTIYAEAMLKHLS